MYIQISLLILLQITALVMELQAQTWYMAPDSKTHTRWISPENPTGEKGSGGLMNKGAKGNAFYIIPPGETQVIMDVEGAGIIQRMWMSGTIARNPEQRRAVIINMYWDGINKPAVSVPIGDFFGTGLGLMVPFDSELFSNPEGRSFNFTIPMPFRTAAKIEIVNESSSQVLFWYDINYLEMKQVPENAMYFHAYWSRNLKTTLGIDFMILPRVMGKGRFLGTNVGVIGGEHYRGTWFGEGEVKIFLDGDRELPTLVGTGTEDYIGSGWGQGHYAGQRFGSLVSDKDQDIYAFYRFHTADAVYFHQDCQVTIQQMGNANRTKLRQIARNGGEFKPVWQLESYDQNILSANGKPMNHRRFLDMDNPPDIFSDDFPANRSTNFYRSDDVSATAYFYLDRPVNNLMPLAPLEIRLKDMEEKVWSKVKMD